MKNDLLRCTRWIGNDQLRQWTEAKLDDAPDYFWTMPASTSGKYHPEYSLGEGGLVRHTRVVVHFVMELGTAWGVDERELDILISSAVLHDTWKCGEKGKHTVYEHPKIASDWAREDSEEGSIRWLVADCILTHMGQWYKEAQPVTQLQWLLHTADYLASRKTIKVDINELKC